MYSKLRTGALIIALVGTFASGVPAQGPMQKTVKYTIMTSHELRMCDYILPPGNYVLYQINHNDLNLFALYRDNMGRSPIALIRTLRKEYKSGNLPEKARILMHEEETSGDPRFVLHGWNIPGEDGWEIIGVVPRDKNVLARAQ